MAVVAPIENLKKAKEDLDKLQSKHPEAYKEFKLFLTNHKLIGYKNIMKMMLYGVTPEELKEL